MSKDKVAKIGKYSFWFPDMQCKEDVLKRKMTQTEVLIKRVLPVFINLGYKINDMVFERFQYDMVVYKNEVGFSEDSIDWLIEIKSESKSFVYENRKQMFSQKEYLQLEKYLKYTSAKKGLLINDKSFIVVYGCLNFPLTHYLITKTWAENYNSIDECEEKLKNIVDWIKNYEIKRYKKEELK